MNRDVSILAEMSDIDTDLGFVVRTNDDDWVTLVCAENLECEVELRREGSFYVYEGCVDSHHTKLRLMTGTLDPVRARWAVDRIRLTTCPCSSKT